MADPENSSEDRGLYFRHETHHPMASEVFELFGNMLNKAGIFEQMRANKIALISSDGLWTAVQGATDHIKGVLAAAGWGFNRHDSKASGGNHPGYNDFLLFQLGRIEEANLGDVGEKRAIQHLFKFAIDVSKSGSGPLIGSSRADFETAWNTVRHGNESYASYREGTNDRPLTLAEKTAIDNFGNSLDTSIVDGHGDNNNDARKEAGLALIDAMKSGGIISQDGYDKSQKGLDEGKTTYAVIAALANLEKSIKGKVTLYEANVERAAALTAIDINEMSTLSFEDIKKSTRLLMDFATNNKGAFGNISDLGSSIFDSMVSSTKEMTKAVGAVGIGDGIEFVNASYDSIKKGATTGEWDDFIENCYKYGASALWSMLMVSATTFVAFKINKVLGAVVAAGWAAYGIVDGWQNFGELALKITADASDYITLASDEILKFTDSVSDGFFDYYGVGRAVPQAIAPFDALYVIDDLDITKPSRIAGTDDSELFFGRNGAVIYGGGGQDEIHHNGHGAVYGQDGGDTILLLNPLGIHVDAGAGNDYILSKNGQGGEFYGGAGRDWIFVKTPGAKLYGDTTDGQPGAGDNGGSNSDNFWWTPNTTIMDAGRNDVLKFFGFPLVGGTNDLPLAVKGGLGSFGSTSGLGLYSSPLYFDNFLPFINYVFIGKDLYVVNTFDALLNIATGDAFRGAMKVNNFERVESAWGLVLPFLDAGTLGMKFKTANPYLALLALLPPVLGGLNKILGLVDETIALFDASIRLTKSLLWVAGVDPLILDLDGDGVETVSLEEAGVWFDHNNNLFAEKSGWLKGDDGFLVLDANGNGSIDEGTEMFGGVGQSGLAELAGYDSNADGQITMADAIWGELRVWRDLDQDAATDAGELFTLDAAGIAALGLQATAINSVTPQGNRLLDRGNFTFSSGGIGTMYDAIFDASAVDTKYRGQTGTAPWLEGVDIDARSFGAIVDLSVAMSNDLAFGETVKAAAAAMTVPKLKLLREQSADVLGQWGQVLEQTRELTAVRIQTIDGKTVLADYGVYEEDATGGFYKLHSGAAITDANGTTIARATLEDVLAQDGFTLTQTFSPSSRGKATQFRAEVPYLTKIVNNRVVILDHGVKQADGSWTLASNPTVSFATANDILASTRATGTSWTTEEIGFNPYADVPVEKIGVYFIDGKAVDYTVEVTDDRGSFYVWAGNDNRKLQAAA
jgi:hypothetical protein